MVKMRVLVVAGWVVGCVAALAGQEARAPEPVAAEDEPLHHLELKNESVVVLHLTLPPGERTLYHTHTHDRVSVDLTKTMVAQQVWQQEERPATETKVGEIYTQTLTGSSFTHRVHNFGPQVYDVVDVELQRRPEVASTAVAGAVAAENPSARVYRWVLEAGKASGMHTHVRPYLILCVTGFPLKMTGADGKTMEHVVKAGEFHWVEGQVTHSLENAGTGAGEVVEIELK